ncbi:hypothetical protein [uncultured Psychroserpens sp.]|uniref:hypothetical protein n=1 Tax=uncultured Psychroserpens sp. TaxID=255436 RepID=UPI0026115F82|nr:hypothetical protein [uncultured Psychroserpens sp.]
MDNKQYALEIATVLNKAKAILPAKELANIMNTFGHTTTYGAQYTGLRGTYTLIHATFDWLTKQGKIDEAEIVAKAFTKPDGSYAY